MGPGHAASERTQELVALREEAKKEKAAKEAVKNAMKVEVAKERKAEAAKLKPIVDDGEKRAIPKWLKNDEESRRIIEEVKRVIMDQYVTTGRLEANPLMDRLWE